MLNKLFAIAIIVITLVAMSSCEKEIMPVPQNDVAWTTTEIEAFKVQVHNLGPDKIQLNALITEQVSKGLSFLSRVQVENILMGLKSATIYDDMIIIRSLGSKQDIVINNQITTFFGYMQIDERADKTHEYTYSLTFDIKNGKVDTSSYSFDFELGCPQAKPCYFDKSVNPTDLSCFGIDEKGNIFYFNLNSYYEEGTIYIRPYEGIKWFIQGYDRNSQQDFVTSLVDYYDDSNNLPMLVEMHSSNIVSVVEIDQNLLKGANSIQLVGVDDNGDEISIGYKVPYSPQLPNQLSFNATFKVTGLYICGKYGCNWYTVKASPSSPVGGPTVYIIKQQIAG